MDLPFADKKVPSEKQWGSIGDVIFEFQTSPVYGSYTESRRALYTSQRLLLTRQPDGSLSGQKPKRQPAGLELITADFDCKVSALVLTTLDLALWEKVALAGGLGGSIAGDMFGEAQKDERFYTDIPKFIDELDALLDSQQPAKFHIGEKYRGLYTLDSMDKNLRHYPNGDVKQGDLSLSLVEWIE